MTHTREVVDLHPPVPDGNHEPPCPGPVVAVEPDAPPIVRAVATRVRVAVRTDSGRQALQRLPGPIALRSVSDAQRVTITRTSDGVHVDTLGSGAPAATLDIDPLSLTVSSANGEAPAVEAVSALLHPDPPALVAAAEDFWALSSPMRGMPGLVLVAVDTGEVVRLGPQEEPYEIHGGDIDLRRLMSGFDWLIPSLRAGKFSIKGTHRQLSVVTGASMKAVYDV